MKKQTQILVGRVALALSLALLVFLSMQNSPAFATTQGSKCGDVNSQTYWDGDQLCHQIGYDGSLFGNAHGHWAGTVDGPGYLTYGPYTNRYNVSLTAWFTASFYLVIDNNTAANDKVATLDVTYNANGKTYVVGVRDVYRHDFIDARRPTQFVLDFLLPANSNGVEFRVYTYAKSYFEVTDVKA